MVLSGKSWSDTIELSLVVHISHSWRCSINFGGINQSHEVSNLFAVYYHWEQWGSSIGAHSEAPHLLKPVLQKDELRWAIVGTEMDSLWLSGDSVCAKVQRSSSGSKWGVYWLRIKLTCSMGRKWNMTANGTQY